MLVLVPLDVKVIPLLLNLNGGSTFSGTYSGSQSDDVGFSSLKICSEFDRWRAVTVSSSPSVTPPVFFRPVVAGGAAVSAGLTAVTAAGLPASAAGFAFTGVPVAVSLTAGTGGALAATLRGGPSLVCSNAWAFFDVPQPIAFASLLPLSPPAATQQQLPTKALLSYMKPREGSRRNRALYYSKTDGVMA